IVAKMTAIFAAWLAAVLCAASALVVWLAMGGHLCLPETLDLVGGHVLYGLLVGAIALFSASISDSASTAAIITLAFTSGSWVLDFSLAGQPCVLGWMSQLSLTQTARHDSPRHERSKHGRQCEPGRLRRGRVCVRRPFGQEPLDQPPRNPAADLRARPTVHSAADCRRGLSGLRARRQRIARARLVPRRPAAADRHRMVAQPTAAKRCSTSHQERRSCMKTSTRTTTIAVAAFGLAALLAYADAAQSVKLDFSDETVGAEPKSFVSVVGVWRIESDGGN